MVELDKIKDRSLRLRVLRDRLQSDLESKISEVEDLSNQIDKLSKVSELFQALLDLLVVKQVKSVEAVVTEGFSSIFHDLDLSFESTVASRYNKIAVDFFIKQGVGDFSHRGKPLEAFGGGPSSVASLILRVLTAARLGRWPFFILDESLAAVSEEYTEATAIFLRELAKKMNVDVLLVTHKQSFCDYAHKSYKCSEGFKDGRRFLVLDSWKT